MTREQSLALMRDRHLTVTANAGSGKTSVLVEKYIDLLLSRSYENPSKIIRSIIAITFTRQAAADMKAKIIKKISDYLLDGVHSAEDLKKLKQLREIISSARVSTIHSFCNSLLREYPIEADISPMFREIDDYENNSLLNFSIELVLERYSEQLTISKNENNDINDEDIKLFGELIDSIGINNLKEYLYSLLNDPVNFSYYKEFYNRNLDDLVSFYHNEYFEIFKNDINDYLLVVNEFIDSIDYEKNEIDRLKFLIKKIENSLQNPIEDEFQNIVREFSELREIKVKTIYSPKGKKFINAILDFIKDNYKSNNSFAKLNEYFLDKLKDSDNIILHTEHSIELILFFLKLAQEAFSDYENQKNELAAYTFDDLLLLTNNLLSKEDVRNNIINELKYILIDEFQDTNKIQYDIVKKLVPALDANYLGASPLAFIVGDAKQSIYGFRSADVSVFNEASNDIKKSNLIQYNTNKINIHTELSENENFGKIVLADTFRLLPAIAMFVNYSCSKIFQFVSNNNSISYEAFICSRKLDIIPSENYTLSSEHGSISFILSIKRYKEEDQTSEIPIEENIDPFEIGEAEQVVNYIKRIVSGDTDIKINKNGELSTPEYKDIAILYRKKKGSQKLISELISNKIPYIIHSGQGFYETQELNDFISLFSFIINQKDDIHFAGILKSPFFNLSDAQLLEISFQQGDYLYDKFNNYTPSLESDILITERTKIILNEILSISARFSISELILRIIELTDYFGAVERFEAKEQIKANINQLINNALDFESKGYKSLYDFLQRIISLSKDSKESEAAYITGENVINLMTVHSSKGLEFPIVILFNSNYKQKNNIGLIKSKKLGFSIPFSSRIEANNISYLDKIETIPTQLIKKINNIEEIEEEARLLYVAMTRAKDHLIVSMTLKENKDGDFSKNNNCFADMLLNNAEIDINSLKTNKFIQINDKLKFPNNLELYLNLKIKLIGYKNSDEIRNVALNNQTKTVQFLLDNNLITDNKFDIASATKITTYKSNQNAFIDRYILGLPELEKNIIRDYDNLETNESNIEGSLAGSLIHKVLENINYWIEDARNNKYEKLDYTIENALFNNNIFKDENLFDRIKNECVSISKNKLIIEYSKYFPYSEFEKELNMPFNNSLIYSSIDLVIKDEKGDFIEIWDWKSNKITNQDEYNELTNHYSYQLKLYLFLISKIYPNKNHYTAKLIFTRLSNSDNFVYKLDMTKNDLDEFEKELTRIIHDMKEN